ncbi:hypothetical protein MYX82_12770 [Acidobacteria bacterium AH-259-D05]|nr:hypothetical protein [Acidobacteria bacterium AH-259-D05]
MSSRIVGQGEDFKQRIRRIRKQQEESIKAADKVVDVEGRRRGGGAGVGLLEI